MVNMTPELEAELRDELAPWETHGLKLAAVRRAYRAARRDWPALPLPVFEEAVYVWVRASNDPEANLDCSLSAFIEQYLLAELEPHVVVEFHGRNRRLMVKAVSRFGQQALTALWESGVSLASDLRTALCQLREALPPIPEDEALALEAARMGVEIR
jgi:hypothetical protein